MKILLAAIIAFYGISCPRIAYPAELEKIADWTILIFMNGDNNLENDAILDFYEMSKVGSNENVNLVLQFDRLGRSGITNPTWDETLRFYVKKGHSPYPEYALDNLGEVNMGDPKSLSAFVEWGLNQFPANNSMLIIWNHGKGWRVVREDLIHELIKKNLDIDNEAETTNGENVLDPAGVIGSTLGAPYRAAGSDESNFKDPLYNREIFEALKSVLVNKKLNVIGFDACLMAMIETAYEFQDVAHYLVGSEELEPGTGWDYEDLMKRINQKIPKDGGEMSQLIVSSYQATYESIDATTTLSAVDLSKVNSLAKALDEFSKVLYNILPQHKESIQEVRKSIPTYAPTLKYHHIDLGKFIDDVMNKFTFDKKVIDTASNTRNALNSTVVFNYAGEKRKRGWGTNGLAIYFPSGLRDYLKDPYSEKGYEKTNKRFPVSFVRENHWSDFLHNYLKNVP